jgi:hypothetical protein
MYVVDGPAIVSVPLNVGEPSKVFLGMTEMLNDAKLCFCDQVVTELERIAKDEQPLVWAKGCSANRAHKGAAYNFIAWVTVDFSDLVDETARDTQEAAAVYVVAQALALRDAGLDVTVVSEDRYRKPTRASVREACEHFGLRCIALVEFLDEVGLLAAEDDDEFVDDEEE